MDGFALDFNFKKFLHSASNYGEVNEESVLVLLENGIECLECNKSV